MSITYVGHIAPRAGLATYFDPNFTQAKAPAKAPELSVLVRLPGSAPQEGVAGLVKDANTAPLSQTQTPTSEKSFWDYMAQSYWAQEVRAPDNVFYLIAGTAMEIFRKNGPESAKTFFDGYKHPSPLMDELLSVR
ncbi:hypothetical protein HYU14_07540 [Candidatus Woesearchaeota archaeon]|nr:hypothetical protein [Candidatus Woesearchaeota archaeon]